MPAHQVKVLKLRPQSVPGYIYLIQAVGTDKFKIGRAINVLNRLRTLQTSSPLKIRYVYHAYVENMNWCEMELHNKFREHREIGEWFTFTPKDVTSCILLMRLLVQTPKPDPKPPLKRNQEPEHDRLEPNKEQIESILQCHAKGIHGKNKILKEVWGVSAGSSQAYRDAKAEYEFLLPFIKGENDEP